MSKVTLLVVAALVGACGSKGGESPAPGGVETGASSPPGAVAPGPGAPGADTAEAAARGMLDALVKADLEAARRMVPDAKACALVPELAACPKLAGLIAESWEQAKGYAAGYATATLARSDEPSPVPGGEVWVATAAGMAPLRLVALKVGDRYYAPPFGGGGPQPPSTGNELPRRNAGMEPAAARALVDEAVALLETGNDAAPCDRIADTLVTALPLAFPGDDVPAEAAPGLKALGRCSDRLRRWRAVVQAASALLKLGPDDKLPARIVRALAEMGEYDRALASAQELATRFPAARTMLAAATTFVFCRAEAWQRCEETAETALAQLGAAQLQPGDEAMLITRLLRATAWVVNGKAPQALEEFAAVQRLAPTLPPSVMELPRLARRTIDLGYYLEVVPVPQLATGVYHLMGRQDTGALVTLKLAEHQGKARTFRVETEVPGVTERSSNTLSLGAGERTVKWTNPPLKFDLEVGKVRSPRPAQLVVKIVESSPGGDKVVVDETLPIELLPRDYLPLKRKTGADSFAPTYGYLGAWLTSNDRAVDDFLARAKDRVPTRNFVGEQDVTVPQVKALYEELRSRGVSYVMDPSVASEQAFVQRTRLPAEVLASTNAQCLEGTLLFATLMEAIGLKPIIILVPGHAFVGWRTVPKDGAKGEPLFVETTMVGGAPFEAAVEVATRRAAHELKTGAFKSGAATMIDVAALRAQGFTAQPM